MNLKIFVVYDSKSEAYLQPFFMLAKGAAIRAFTDLVNNKEHQFGKYPADYTLFEMGEYDDESAKIVTLPALVNLGVGTEFVNQ